MSKRRSESANDGASDGQSGRPPERRARRQLEQPAAQPAATTADEQAANGLEMNTTNFEMERVNRGGQDSDDFESDFSSCASNTGEHHDGLSRPSGGRAEQGTSQARVEVLSQPKEVQLLSVATSTPRHTRNADLADKIRCKWVGRPEGLEAELKRRLLPEHLEFYAKTIHCTHAGEPRKRASTARPHQFHRGIKCPAKINVCAQFNRHLGRWMVNITNYSLVHNHPLTEEIWEGYPRRVRDEELLRTVGKMERHGTPRRGILEYLVGASPIAPTIKDVHNIVAKMKRERYAAYPSPAARVRRFLCDFCKQPGHIGRPFTYRPSTTGKMRVKAVTLQTAHMRKMFELFPEVVLVDATHDTNNANYKLFSFMVHDAMGRGQQVQYSLIEDEKGATLRTVSRQFKRANPAWNKIRAIIMDKDFTEMAIIADEFHGARILLCQWHVIHYLEQELAKSKYGLTDWQRSTMRVALHELIHAPSEAVYTSRIEFISGVLQTQEKIDKWFEYFDPNWTGIKENWCSMYRCELPHLGNHTNNRLESSWGKLKALVKKTSDVAESLVSILFWQRVLETRWRREVTRIGKRHLTGGDGELNKLAAVVSRYAFDLVKDQYDFAIATSTEYHMYTLMAITFVSYRPPRQPSPPPIRGQGSQPQRNVNSARDLWVEHTDDEVPDEYSISLKDGTCSCDFMMTRLLPCRHLLYVRKQKFPNDVIPVGQIHRRWRLDMVQDHSGDEFDDALNGGDEEEGSFEEQFPEQEIRSRVLTRNERFNKLFVVAKQIAETASEHGTAHVLQIEQRLHDFLELIKMGEIPYVQVLPPPSAESDADSQQVRYGSNAASQVCSVPVARNQHSKDNNRPNIDDVPDMTMPQNENLN